MIRIRSTQDKHCRAVVEMEDGTPVPGVTDCIVTISAGEPVRATVNLFARIDVLAHPLISRETLERAAEAYGLALVPLAEGGNA